MKKIKGFKGFDKDLKCRGFQYEIGKTYTIDGDIEICQKGFHFCKKFFDINNYYCFSDDNNRYCEIEALGTVIDDENGSKSVTNKIKIVREISREEFMETYANIGAENSGYCNTGNRNTGDCNTGNRNTGYCNTGDCNTGNCNTGNRNTGDWNTGYWNTGNRNTGNRNTGYCNTGNRNTGDCNTGDCNTGNRNTGDCNTGDWNTGNRNTGDWNTGDCNTGYCNTGNRNTGDCNTGNRNTGDWNTGYWNTGNRNTGDWNKTDRSSGVFCTEQPKLFIFNKETDMTFEEWRSTRAYDLLSYINFKQWIYADDMTDEEKSKYPGYKTTDGYLKTLSRKEAVSNWWKELDNYDKQEIFKLPNFDLKIFNEIMEIKITKKEYNEVMKQC